MTIFIQQMGKVGSQALETRLKDFIHYEQLRRDHGLTEVFSSQLRAIAAMGQERGDLLPIEAASLEYQAEYADNSRVLYQNLHSAGSDFHVIAGFREPLSFIVSNCFQLMSVLLPAHNHFHDCNLSCAELMMAYIKKIALLAQTGTETGSSPLDMLASIARYRTVDWWQNEWLGFHDLNIKSFRPSDKAPVWVAQPDNRHFWMYRAEDGAPAMSHILSHIVKQDAVDVPRVNDGRQKAYKDIYHLVRQKIDFDDDVKAFFWSLPYVKQLYPNNEAEVFWHKWRRVS